MSSKHGANSWDDYLNVHQRRIADLAGHFIVEDKVEFTRTAAQVLWEGEIRCLGGIEVHVRKRQVVQYRAGWPWVRTVDYEDMDAKVADAGWVVPQSAGATTSVDTSFWTAVKVGAGLVVGGALVSIAIWVVLGVLIMIGINLPATP